MVTKEVSLSDCCTPDRCSFSSLGLNCVFVCAIFNVFYHYFYSVNFNSIFSRLNFEVILVFLLSLSKDVMILPEPFLFQHFPIFCNIIQTVNLRFCNLFNSFMI